MGLTKLSMLLMTNTPQATMKMAQPLWPSSCSFGGGAAPDEVGLITAPMER